MVSVEGDTIFAIIRIVSKQVFDYTEENFICRYAEFFAGKQVGVIGLGI